MTVAERMRLAETQSDRFKQDRTEVFSLLDEWLSWWRDVMLTQAGAENGIANVDSIEDLREAASRYPARDLRHFVESMIATKEHLDANVQSKIALESLLLEAPSPDRTPTRM
jgi:DNA polymerase-3 subunit delta'